MGRGRKPGDKTPAKKIPKYFTRSTEHSRENLKTVEVDTDSNMATQSRGNTLDRMDNTPKQGNSEQNSVPGAERLADPTAVLSLDNSTSQATKEPKSTLVTNSTESSGLHNVERRLIAVLAKLELKVDNINTTTENLKTEFEVKLNQMSEDLKQNRKKVGDLEQSVNYAHKTIEEQKEKTVNLEKRQNT